MPTGTPYNSFVAPYRIRVDDFSSLSSEPDKAPLLHLLTHTHTDHINGLSAKSFGYKVYCSHDAKTMLLKHEVFAERELHTMELRAEKIRTFSHLKVDPVQYTDGHMYYTGSRDLLHPLALHTPTHISLEGDESVTITLLDSNHCPGAVMFLIEGSRGAVLHTGDVRAEPWFLDSMLRNPFLQKYLSHNIGQEENDGATGVSHTLEAIYLDTASVLSEFEVPSKTSATSGLIELMKLFPKSVYFFLNCWTWGYEDILKEVALHFQSRIHVDRYKLSIFQSLSSDPFLGQIVTSDPSSTRFHACERFHRCDYVAVDNDSNFTYANATSSMGKRVIYVNPVNMEKSKWEEYIQDTKSRLQSGEEINNLLVPLLRHSTLPELQAFVSLFRPKRVVPNTLEPRLKGLDWICLDRMFAPYLHASMQHTTPDSATLLKWLGIDPNDRLAEGTLEDGDVTLKNLIGEGSSEIADRWADHGKLLKKVSILRKYLGADDNHLIDELVGISKPKVFQGRFFDYQRPTSYEDKGKRVASRYDEIDSDESTDCDSDRGRTAHILFASSDDKENIWWASSQPDEEDQVITEEAVDQGTPIKTPTAPGGDGAWRLNRMTPGSSPVRLPQRLNPKPHLKSPRPTEANMMHAVDESGNDANQGQPRLLTNLLASPICLAIPSSPDIRPLTPTRSRNPCASKSRTLAFPAISTAVSLTSRHAPEKSARNTRPLYPLKNQTSRPRSTQTTRSNLTSSKKRRRQDDETNLQPTTKKPRHNAPRSSKKSLAINTNVCETSIASNATNSGRPRSSMSSKAIPADSSTSQRDALRLKRIHIAQQLSKAFPDMAAPSYTSKIDKQKRAKQKNMETTRPNISIASQTSSESDSFHLDLSVAGSSRKLVPARTLPSFESLEEDGDRDMDFNRSRMLAEAVRDDVKHGRKLSLPALSCAQSQSPATSNKRS